jgi:hypothetical protein
MHLSPRLPHLATVLLLAATPGIGAESPLPDPVPPAVIGRPLDQIKPARPVRHKAAAARVRSNEARQVASGDKVVTMPSPRAAVAAAPAAVMGNAGSQRLAKAAIDDRVDPRATFADDVGKGSHLARKPLDAGAYIGSKYQALVRQFYQAHPASEKRASWKIGEPVPPKSVLSGVPDDLRAKLPVVPPGHQYVQVDGEVVLLALQSRMVVDGVSRLR